MMRVWFLRTGRRDEGRNKKNQILTIVKIVKIAGQNVSQEACKNDGSIFRSGEGRMP